MFEFIPSIFYVNVDMEIRSNLVAVRELLPNIVKQLTVKYSQQYTIIWLYISYWW